MFTQKVKLIVLTLIALTLTASAAFAVDGWASMNGGTTGGAGGPTVTVTNEADLAYYVNLPADQPYIIQVQGTIVCDNPIWVKSNKTIIGLGSDATVDTSILLRMEGGVDVGNIIIQNLTITNPRGLYEADGIQIKYSIHNVWVDHCTFIDCGDGSLDVTQQSDYVTVSWCKFYYTFDSTHNFVNLIGSDDGATADRGKLKVTFHHNWWYTMAKERMPRVRFGQVHVYNNYYSDLLAGGYCAGVGTECQIRLESNYFNGVTAAWKNYSVKTQGKIGWDNDNQFYNCTIPTWAPNDYATIFVPPYSYTIDDGLSVPGIVMAGAGAGGGGPTPTPTATPTPTPTATPTPTPPPPLFSDGFESGNFTAGGWTTQNTNATVSTKAEYTGAYGAKLAGTTWMQKAVSTVGKSTIHVKYARKTYGLDAGEYLYVEWSIDGSVWNNLETTQATTWAVQDITCGSGANNNANFRVRWRTNASATTEYAYVDDVSVSGT